MILISDLLLKRIIFAFAILIGPASIAQERLINPANLDFDFLNHQVYLQINTIRKEAKVSSLSRHALLDSIAHQIAQAYSPNTRTTTSKQSASIKFTALGIKPKAVGEFLYTTYLEERLNFFEPIPNYSYRNQLYRQTANNVVQAIAASHDGRTKLNNPIFSQVGIGIVLDTASYALVVVHVFSAELPEQPVPQPDAAAMTFDLFKPASKLWFKRAKRANQNLRLAQAWSGTSVFEGWISTRKRAIRRAFPWFHFRSGLVLEVRSADQFKVEPDYGSERARNNQTGLLNGTLGTRFRRHDIMAMWKSQTEKIPLRILGWKAPIKIWPKFVNLKIPATDEPQSTSQALVIRKGKLCNILTYNPGPGKMLTPEFPKLPFLLPQSSRMPDTTTVHKSDSSALQVYYARGITTLTDDDQQGLLDMVPAGSRVKKIKIRAHASIEGTAAGNQKIFDQRAETIKAFLEKNDVATTDVTLELTTLENWPMMWDQLRADSVWSAFSNMSEAEIRSKINARLSDNKINAWLDEQRFAWVSYEVTRPEQKAETPADVLASFNAIKNAGKFTPASISKMAGLQKRYYDLLAGLNQTADDELVIPDDSKMTALIYQQMVFQNQSFYLSDDNFHLAAQQLFQQKNTGSGIRRACLQHHQVWLANALYYSQALTPTKEEWNCPVEKNQSLNWVLVRKHKHYYSKYPSMVESLDILPGLVKLYQQQAQYKNISRKLDFYFYVTRAQELLMQDKFVYLQEIKRLSAEVWKRHVVPYRYSDDELVDFALFFNLTHNRQYAIRLLAPLVNREKPHQEALKIWISLNYNAAQERKTEVELLKARIKLDPDQWRDLVQSGSYLPLTLLERFKVRHAWYSNISSK